jgi:hypothetical protein
MAFTNNYTLGRGEIYFARKDPVTGNLGGERYIGNTPAANLTAEEEKLEHFSSDRGIRIKDKTVTLQVNYTGTLEVDNIDYENVALFFLGESEQLTIAQTTVTAEQVGITGVGVEKGMFYQLGTTANNPSGAKGVIFPGAAGTAFVLNKGAAALVHGTDYRLDAALGRIEILESSVTVEDGDVLTCTYTVAASTRKRVISGSTAVNGSLRYIAYNPEGEQIDYFMPSVTLSPNGDFALKSDEWQVIPFNIDVVKRDDLTAAIYADGRALSA